MAGTTKLVTENFMRLNFSPKSGVTPGTNDILNMDCDQIKLRYIVAISGASSTGVRLPGQNQLSQPSLPYFIAASSGNATSSSMEVSASIFSDGGCTITSRGFQWSTDNSFSTILGSVTVGSGGGQYGTTITGLSCGTHYYFRPWAVNCVGIYYADGLIGSGSYTDAC